MVADVINLRSYCPGCGRCVKPGHSSSNRTPEYEPRSFSAVCVGTHSASLSLSAINCICTMCSTMEAELELACQPLGFSVCTGCKSCTWGQFAQPVCFRAQERPRNGGTDLNRGQPTCPSFCSHISVDSALSAFSADITHPRSSNMKSSLFSAPHGSSFLITSQQVVHE